MTLDYRFTALQQATGVSPAEVRTSIDDLRKRSLQCSELADSCLTEEGKDALLKMSVDYDAEVSELMETLAALETLCERALEARSSAAVEPA